MANSPREQYEATKEQLDAAREQFEATSKKLKERTGRDLFVAIATGLLFGGIFVASVFISIEFFALLTAALVIITVLELSLAFRVNGRRIPRTATVGFALLILAAAYVFGAGAMLLALGVSAIGLTIWRLTEGLIARPHVEPRTLLRDVSAGIFTLVYLAFFGGFAVLLTHIENGAWWIFSMIAIVVAVDIGAFAAGVTLGKHKMVPTISPNKTWEGFAGAAILSGVVAIALGVTVLDIAWWQAALLALGLLCSATVGDLTESLIKRNLGIKDMSDWIPGHGGFLDRLDSVFPSTVVVYAAYLLFVGAS